MKKLTYLSILFCVILLSCRKDPVLEKWDGSISVTNPPDSVIPADFVAGVNNKYFPLIPGRIFHYIKTIPNGADTIRQTITTEVTSQTKLIQGITCMVVRETVKQDTTTLEDTYSWYAQDLEGTVWKFGKDKKTFTAGTVNTQGSWIAGVDSARAGIKMHANPGAHLGELYYQEYALGVAEDQGQVHDTVWTATVPYGTFPNCVRIHDSTALDPTATTHKYYAAGIGLVQVLNIGQTVRTELIGIDTIPASITIQNLAFTPPTIIIPAGSTVTWTNLDNLTHTVTADDESFTSPGIPNGGTYSRVFSTAGTYNYHCTPHPQMKGSIIVQ